MLQPMMNSRVNELDMEENMKLSFKLLMVHLILELLCDLEAHNSILVINNKTDATANRNRILNKLLLCLLKTSFKQEGIRSDPTRKRRVHTLDRGEAVCAYSRSRA